jgi:hypothetical protein
VEWEQQRADQAVRDRPQRAQATQANRTTRTEARKTAAARRESVESRRTAKHEAQKLEQAVHAAEARIAELERGLADPALYDSGADGAREAGRLSAELTKTRRALDDALARWTEASDALDAQ